MAVERIDSIIDIPSINAEFSALKAGLVDSQKGLTALYDLIKSFKDTTLSNLAANSEKLSEAITGSVNSTAKANQVFDQFTQRIIAQSQQVKDNVAAMSLQGAAYDQLVRKAVQNRLANDELNRSLKDVKVAFEKGETTLEQYTTSLESIKSAQQTLKTSNADINKSLNNLEKQAQSSATSVDGLQAKINLLRQAYDKLSEEERGTEEGSALTKNIQETDAALQKLKNDTGRFQDNVGNYAGAFAEPFKVLQAQLEHLRQEFKATGGVDPNQAKNIATIEGQLERLSQGFKTTRMESRAFQEAAVQMGLALGIESEEFQTFDKAVGHTQNAINDLKAAAKFQAKDAKFIVGLADGAATLAGAFGAADAAVSLFAGDNEDLQKQMAHFQKLLVLINGLQQVANGLQAESGGMQLLLAAKTNLLNAAKATQLLLTTKAVQALTSETAATGANALAKETQTAATGEQVVAEEAQTAATVENTEATIANTAATGAAKTAAVGLSTAFIAGGIAVLAIGAGVALALLTAKLIGYGQIVGLTIKQQEEMAQAMKDANDIIIAQTESIDALDSSTKKYYQNQLALSQAAGQNQYRQFALQKELNAAEKQSAQERIDQLGATNKQQAELAGTIDLLNIKRLAAVRIEQELLAIPEKNLTGGQKDQLKAAQANVEFYQKQIDGIKGLYDAGEKARQDLFAATQKEGQQELAEAKFSADEQRKVALETAKIQVEAVKNKNAKILSEQDSTLKERLAAIRSNAQQEKKLAEAEFINVQKDPSTTPAALLIARRQLNGKIVQADADAAKQSQDINRTYYERQRDARFEIFKSAIDNSLQYEQAILSKKIGTEEGDTTGDRKVQALQSQFDLNKQLIEQERQHDLDQEKFAKDDKAANEEKLSINRKYNDQLDILGRKFLDDQRSLNKEVKEATLAEWDKYYQARKTQLDKETNLELDALNERLGKKKISEQKYQEERKLIEDKNALSTIEIEVMNDYLKVQSYEKGTKARLDAETKLTQDLRKLNDQQLKNEQDKDAIRKARTERVLDEVNTQSQNYAQAITDVLDISYNTQKVHLEQLEVRQQRAYEQEVKNITDSSATEEQKAIRLKILDDQRAVQKQQNDRKQRQLDIQKAQFDKAKDILGIITGTALAVVKALPNIPLAVSVGILGAAELAAAIATPLPHYAEGTKDHPGGKAIVGDAFESELILEPGKKARWSKDIPTVEDLLPHTKVIPPNQIRGWISSGMMVNQEGVLIVQSDNKKELREIREAIIWQTQRTEQAIAKNKGKTFIQNKIDTNWGHYIQNEVFK